MIKGRARQWVTVVAVSAAVAAIAASTSAVASDSRSQTGNTLHESLSGYAETPLAISTAGDGRFRINIDEGSQTISYRLSYEDLEGTVTQAHIHFGDHHTNGGISVFLCTNLGNSTTAVACPNGPGRHVVTGTATAADVVGPAGQGIAPGEFEELKQAMRAQRTYANVHTVQFAGGEIRGQIRVDD